MKKILIALLFIASSLFGQQIVRHPIWVDLGAGVTTPKAQYSLYPFGNQLGNLGATGTRWNFAWFDTTTTNHLVASTLAGGVMSGTSLALGATGSQFTQDITSNKWTLKNDAASPASLVTVDSSGAVTATDLTLTNRSYHFAYRTTSFNFAANNTWYWLKYDSTGASNNVTHTDSTFTVSKAGIYQIIYSVFSHRGEAGHHLGMRLFKNNTSEVLGSWCGDSPTSSDGNQNNNLEKTTLVNLSANDYISVQVGADYTGDLINYFDSATFPNPSNWVLASITIIRISP